MSCVFSHWRTLGNDTPFYQIGDDSWPCPTVLMTNMFLLWPVYKGAWWTPETRLTADSINREKAKWPAAIQVF